MSGIKTFVCMDCGFDMQLSIDNSLHCQHCGLLLIDINHYFQKKKKTTYSKAIEFSKESRQFANITPSNNDAILLLAINNNPTDITPIIPLLRHIKDIHTKLIELFYLFKNEGFTLEEWLSILNVSIPTIDPNTLSLFLERIIEQALKGKLLELGEKNHLTTDEKAEYLLLVKNLK